MKKQKTYLNFIKYYFMVVSKHPFFHSIIPISQTLVKQYLFLAYRPLFLFITQTLIKWTSTPGQRDQITMHTCVHTHACYPVCLFGQSQEKSWDTTTTQVLRIMRCVLLDFTTHSCLQPLYKLYKIFNVQSAGSHLTMLWNSFYIM